MPPKLRRSVPCCGRRADDCFKAGQFLASKSRVLEEMAEKETDPKSAESLYSSAFEAENRGVGRFLRCRCAQPLWLQRPPRPRSFPKLTASSPDLPTMLHQGQDGVA